jgi:hypothetical protein
MTFQDLSKILSVKMKKILLNQKMMEEREELSLVMSKNNNKNIWMIMFGKQNKDEEKNEEK